MVHEIQQRGSFRVVLPGTIRFEAHEVWEDVWAETAGPERRFYQALIQAAVGLHHFGNGNLRGAVKLYHSSRNYMAPFGSPYLGLDTTRFWMDMERCFRDVLAVAGAAANQQGSDARHLLRRRSRAFLQRLGRHRQRLPRGPGGP